MQGIPYKEYVIYPKHHEVGKRHEMGGKWVSGEYTIGRHSGGAYTEKPFVHKEAFHDTEEQAMSRTLQLAKMTIDQDLVGF